jgi:hypothetical protein
MALAFKIKTFDCDISRASIHDRHYFIVCLKYACFITHNDLIGFELFTAVTMKITIFWVVTPRGSLRT